MFVLCCSLCSRFRLSGTQHSTAMCLNNCNDYSRYFPSTPATFHRSFSHFKLNHKLSFCRCEFLKFVSFLAFSTSFMLCFCSIPTLCSRSAAWRVCLRNNKHICDIKCNPRIFCFAIISRVFVTFHTARKRCANLSSGDEMETMKRERRKKSPHISHSANYFFVTLSPMPSPQHTASLFFPLR